MKKSAPDLRYLAALSLLGTPVFPACSGRAVENVEPPSGDMSVPGQSRCSIRPNILNPLVVEWSAADRAALESRASKGLVAVRYVGCDLEILPRCVTGGTYAFQGLTKKREQVRIRHADDLYAKLPLGAIELEGKLENSGQLNVDTIIVGRTEASHDIFVAGEMGQGCGDATHVITGMAIGAFSLYTGKFSEANAGVHIGAAGGGVKSASDVEILQQDGSEDECPSVNSGSAGAPAGCGAIVRIEMVPIEGVVASSVPVGAEKMILIRGGVTMGRRIPDFYLDQTEVTVSQYRRCVVEGGCRRPVRKFGNRVFFPLNYDVSLKSDHPVNGVSWRDARRFCEWSGKRLPTDWEWEWAARGREESRTYPWGEDAPSCEYTVMQTDPPPDGYRGESGCGSGATWAVGTKPTDMTRDGVLDMGGNVKEWTDDGTLRGGSYSDDRDWFQRYSDGVPAKKTWRRGDVGFRCAKGSL